MLLSAVVVVRNEAALLVECLPRLSFADEVLVLDMESTDDSSHVAASHGARVIRIPVEPIAERVRNTGFEESQGEWVLFIDPDEFVPPVTGGQIRTVLGNATAVGYYLPFRTFAFGRPLEHGFGLWPMLRLTRRDSARYPAGELPAHTLPQVNGPVESLVGRIEPIEHHCFRDISQVIEKSLRYAQSRGTTLGPVQTPDLLYAHKMLLRNLVLLELWRDGSAGLVAGAMVAIGDTLAHFYAWEALGYPEIGGGGRSAISNPSFDQLWGSLSRSSRSTLLNWIDHQTRPRREAREVFGWLRDAGRLAPRILLTKSAAKLALAALIPARVRAAIRRLSTEGESTRPGTSFSRDSRP
jgi:hypothetical protein